MLSNHEIEQVLQFCSQEVRDIVLELRNLVAEVAPDATELTHSKGLSYYHAERGGPVSAGVCQIILFPEHVRLAFIHGAFLKDPLGLLEGQRLAKRYVRILSFDQAPWEALKALIIESAQFDPYAPRRESYQLP